MYLRIFIAVLLLMLPVNASAAMLRVVFKADVPVERGVGALLEEQRRVLETIGVKCDNHQTPAPVVVTAVEVEEISVKQLSAPKRYGSIIRRAAERYADSGITQEILAAVAEVESSWNHEACSVAGACGLMQLMPGTAAELGVRDVHNPEQNIMGGAKYLAKLMRMFNGDVLKALAAYNAGHDRVSRAIRQEGNFINYLPKETRLYVAKVMRKLSM